VCVYVRVYVCVFMRLLLSLQQPEVRRHKHAHMYVCVYVHVCMAVPVWVCGLCMHVERGGGGKRGAATLTTILAY
jgi:hypothetical protein